MGDNNKKLTNNLIFKEEFLYPTNAVLTVTDDCNLKCRYCFVEQHPHFMDIQTALDSIDWIYNNIQKRKALGYPKQKLRSFFNFFGGEPLLLFDSIIKPTVLYAEKKYPGYFIWGITTNGTLLTVDILNFLKEHNFGIMFSMDGAELTQNYNRPCKDPTKNSFDLIKDKVQLINEYFPDAIFRSTLYPDTCHLLFENYYYADCLGFNRYFIMPTNFSEWTDEHKNIISKELQKIFLFRANEYRKGITPMHFSMIDWGFKSIIAKDLQSLNNLDSPSPNNNKIYRCGLGNSSCSIGFDGKVYGCQEKVSLENKDIFFIGDIYNGIDKEKQQKILTLYFNKDYPHCINKDFCNENCLIRSICDGEECISHSYTLYNDFSTQPEIRCFWKKEFFKNCAISMLLLKDNNDFKKYLYTLGIYKDLITKDMLNQEE